LRAVPVIDDAVIPVEKCAEFISQVEQIFSNVGQKTYAFWGQAGNGVIHSAPLFDIAQIGDKQKMFKLIDEYYNLVVQMGGSIAGEFAEGRLRGGQSAKMFTPEILSVMNQIKSIFDPFNIMNPGVKINVDNDSLKSMIRKNYTLDHQYSHLPRG
jgi:FAD/FMN-containing dehydrogenase